MELTLKDYREVIHLDESYHLQSNDNWQELIPLVLENFNIVLPNNLSTDEKLSVLHGVLAPIDPYIFNDDLIEKLETIAKGSNHLKGITESLNLPTIAEAYNSNYAAAEQTSLWIGDITTIGVDAIVNAANSELLGCRAPNHACIDNVIHLAAGPRLRDDCASIIRKQQGRHEPIGSAKVTRGYALNAGYVLQTVGPHLYPGAKPTAEQQQQLISAYNACLDVAADVKEIRTIAFCAISTGIFSYPKHEAAKIALTTVEKWLSANPDRFDRIVFNLYTSADAAIYQEILNDY